MFPILACVVAVATFTQLLAFTVMGERLTTRLRDLAFRNIVRQVRARSFPFCLCSSFWGERQLDKSLVRIVLLTRRPPATRPDTHTPHRAGAHDPTQTPTTSQTQTPQDVAYFDKEENSTGAITARLATEVTLVKNVTGQNLGRSVQNVVTVAAAFTIAFVFGSLKMSLVLLGVLPLMVLGSFAQMRALRTNTDKSQAAIATAGGVAVQAITGIRTVTAFNMTPKLLALYSAALRKPMLLGIRNALLRGLTLGLSQFVVRCGVSGRGVGGSGVWKGGEGTQMQCTHTYTHHNRHRPPISSNPTLHPTPNSKQQTLASYGALFYYGTTLVLASAPEDRGRAFQRMLRSLMAVTMSAQGIGQNTSFLGDQAAANSAAARIFAVVDRKPVIDSTGEGGEVLAKVEGKIEFKRVDFTYPARPEQRIFRRFSLTVGACWFGVGVWVGWM